MNKAQIDYIHVVLEHAYITGIVDGENKKHNFLDMAEGYAKVIDRLSTPEANAKLVGMAKIDDDCERVTHCRDCVYFKIYTDYFGGRCNYHESNVWGSDYCSWARTKEDEK